MLLHEWEIWHTYATFFRQSFNRLEDVAHSLAASGFAECVLLRDGLTYWRSKTGFQRGLSTVELSGDRQSATFELTDLEGEDVDFDDYALESWGVGVQLRFSELRLFVDDFSLPPPYVRAFLGPCQLGKENKLVICYPIVTLYESGVIMVQFRVIGPDRSVDLEELINHHLNLYQDRFDDVFVPPTISALAPRAYRLYTYPPRGLIGRIRMRRHQALHTKEVVKLGRIDQAGDFSHKLAPLISVPGEKDSVTSLAHTIFSIVGYLSSIPRTRLKSLLLGHSTLPKLGNYWSGRPHVHIVRHERQARTASENENVHKEEFGWILARTHGRSGETSQRYVPPSARPFEDYSAYITSASTLWVWSRDGLKSQQPWADLNRGHLIYEHQAQIELLEYGNMLHRSLVENTTELSRMTDVFRVRKDLAYLKGRMSQASPYGEVRDLLLNGWDAMGLETLREEIDENLSILESEIQFAESRRSERLQIALTIVFGVVAVPPIAESVIKPLWSLLGFWQPPSVSLNLLFFVAIAASIVAIVVYGLVRKAAPNT